MSSLRTPKPRPKEDGIVARSKQLTQWRLKSPEQVRLWKLRAWSTNVSGVTPIDRIEPTWPCSFAGVVQKVRIDPRDRSIEASIHDGTGCITTRWRERSSFSGLHVAPGVGLMVTGLPALGADGQLVVIEPSYEVVPGLDGT